jgi:oxalate decarboxylase/phosphoglucose isomerase-like protein (cupin superfamily)
MDVQEGDVGYILQSNPHYIENTEDTDLVFLEMFDTGRYEDISLAEWMARTPHQLTDRHLHVGRAMIDAVPQRRDSDHLSMTGSNRIDFCARRLAGHSRHVDSESLG